MEQKVIQVGNSLAIIIPQKLAKQYKIKKGSAVYLKADAGDDGFRISTSERAQNGLTPEFFAWTKETIEKNRELLTKLAKFHGKND